MISSLVPKSALAWQVFGASLPDQCEAVLCPVGDIKAPASRSSWVWRQWVAVMVVTHSTCDLLFAVERWA